MTEKSILGSIIGDIVGSRFEFNNYRGKDFELFGRGCFATDDSIMTAVLHDMHTTGIPCKYYHPNQQNQPQEVSAYESDRHRAPH